MKRTLLLVAVWLLLAADVIFAVATIAEGPSDPAGWAAVAIIYLPLGALFVWLGRRLGRRPADVAQAGEPLAAIASLPVVEPTGLRLAPAGMTAGGAAFFSRPSGAGAPAFAVQPAGGAPMLTGATVRPSPQERRHRMEGAKTGLSIAGAIAVILVIAAVKVAVFEGITSGFNAVHDMVTDRDGARHRGTPAATAGINRLAAAPVAASLLPTGFSHATGSPLTILPKQLTDHHVMAGSSIDLAGPDDIDYVRYYGFAIKEDAQDFNTSVIPVPLDNSSFGAASTPAGFSQPVHCRQFSAEGTDQTKYTGTTCYMLAGTVRIAGTAVAAGTDGRRDNAIALLKLGLQQYQAATTSTAGTTY